MHFVVIYVGDIFFVPDHFLKLVQINLPHTLLRLERTSFSSCTNFPLIPGDKETMFTLVPKYKLVNVHLKIEKLTRHYNRNHPANMQNAPIVSTNFVCTLHQHMNPNVVFKFSRSMNKSKPQKAEKG